MSGFPDSLVERAWARCGGVCECEREGHHHKGRCRNSLMKSARGDRYSYFGWEAHSKSGHFLNDLNDVEILCWEQCYEVVNKK